MLFIAQWHADRLSGALYTPTDVEFDDDARTDVADQPEVEDPARV